MTQRISQTFSRLRESGSRALIPYLTAGFPSRDSTLALLRAIDRGGADVIELGVPFSDPVADGPTIQRASTQSLLAGTTLCSVIETVRAFRQQSEKPIVLFGAYNPFFHYGIERLVSDAGAAGADALLIPDLPADESDEIAPIVEAAGLDLIYLIAPTTDLERKRMICRRAKGFIYYISLKGVTGARTSLATDLEQPLREIKSCTDLPVAVGFGVSTPEQARQISRYADGVVVGSALIDLICKESIGERLESQVEEFIRGMKQALSADPAGTVAS